MCLVFRIFTLSFRSSDWKHLSMQQLIVNFTQEIFHSCVNKLKWSHMDSLMTGSWKIENSTIDKIHLLFEPKLWEIDCLVQVYLYSLLHITHHQKHLQPHFKQAKANTLALCNQLHQFLFVICLIVRTIIAAGLRYLAKQPFFHAFTDNIGIKESANQFFSIWCFTYITFT